VNYVPEKVVFHIATSSQDVVEIRDVLFLRSPIAGSDTDFKRVVLPIGILSSYYDSKSVFAAALAGHLGCDVTDITEIH
jgi:hypothetical protein